MSMGSLPLGDGVARWMVGAGPVHLPSSFLDGTLAGGGNLTAGVSEAVVVRFRDRYGNPVTVVDPGSVLDGLMLVG